MSNSETTDKSDVEKLNKKIEHLCLEMIKKEDDIKNIINEKDIIIKEISKKVVNHERRITELENQVRQHEITIHNLKNTQNNIKTNIPIFHKNENSKIFNFQDMCLISDGVKNNLKKSIKNYELLFKASRDGYKSYDFHQKCDGHNYTLTFILTKEGRRFGGFTDLSWDGTSFEKKGGNSFTFSLDKQEIYYKIDDDVDEIRTFSLYGPDFREFRLEDNCNIKENNESDYHVSYDIKENNNYYKRYSYYNSDYEEFRFAGNKTFLVEDYEVYKIYLD